MKDYQNTLFTQLDRSLSNGKKCTVYLEAGHYDPRQQITKFSEESLKEAISFGGEIIQQFKGKIRIAFGILVNDLLLQCGAEGACTIGPQAPRQEGLPASYDAIFEKSRFVKQDRLFLFFERSSKNRAAKTLKNLLKSGNEGIILKEEDQEDSIYFKNFEEDDILLARKKDAIFRIQCPAIMGQHYKDVCEKVTKRFLHSEDLIIVDWSEMIDFSKVTSGAQAYHKVFQKHDLPINTNILNIFYQDNMGNQTTFEETVNLY